MKAQGLIGDSCVKWKHFLSDVSGVADHTGTVRESIDRVEMSLKPGFHMIVAVIVSIWRRLIRYKSPNSFLFILTLYRVKTFSCYEITVLQCVLLKYRRKTKQKKSWLINKLLILVNTLKSPIFKKSYRKEKEIKLQQKGKSIEFVLDEGSM